MTNIPDSETILWENLDRPWQNRLKSAINSENMPKCLIYPENETALSEIVRLAHSENLKLLLCGNGTKLNWGGLISHADMVVSTRKMNRIIDHAVGDLTLTVEAGVTLKEIQETLKPYNQFLPIDPSYPENATIGGIVATADTGSLRQRYGGIRDLILGLSFVRADGNIAKAGGRVVKNVAGYDLMKLFTGSYGTLGVISQITFRLYPLPPASQTVVCLTGSREQTEKLQRAILNSTLTPTCADLISAKLRQQLGLSKKYGLVLRFQTIPESINAQIDQLKSWQQEFDLKFANYTGNEETIFWQEMHNLIHLNSSVMCKVGILPVCGFAALDFFEGMGIINISSGIGKKSWSQLEDTKSLLEMRQFCEHYRGFLTILSAPKEIKTDLKNWGYTGNYVNLMAKIKEQFDPQNILSYGRYF